MKCVCLCVVGMFFLPFFFFLFLLFLFFFLLFFFRRQRSTFSIDKFQKEEKERKKERMESRGEEKERKKERMDRVVVGKKGNWMGFVLVSRERGREQNCRTEKRKDDGRGKGSKDVRRGRREREIE